MVTIKQLKRQVEIFQGAAAVLLDNGYPGQAVARAHYAVHALCSYIAESVPVLWPVDATGDRYSTLPHNRVPGIVQAVFVQVRARGGSLHPIMTPERALIEAKGVYTGRIDADYRPERDTSKEVAVKRITASRTLCHILMAEAEHLNTEARQVTQQDESERSGT